MQIRFSDGARYERFMGSWSRGAGNVFLDWLQPQAQAVWLDVGCGSGAFSSLVLERCAPKSLLGIDPSEAQVAFARDRGLGPTAVFERGDAANIELPDQCVDIAVAALVLHFMPDPALGVREMARVVRPGGIVASYTWDLEGGGFPYEAMNRAARDCDFAVPTPPHPEAGDAGEMKRLWMQAGLSNIEGREIQVTQEFQGFDDFWATAILSPRLAAAISSLPPDELRRLEEAARRHVPNPPRINARANVIKGTVSA